MPTNVVMPQMGESIAEGTIVRWIKRVGDEVLRDEPLFEISTDKVDAEIPSPAEGVLREIRAREGDTVPVGKVVAVIGEAGEEIAPSAPVAASPPPAAAGAPPEHVTKEAGQPQPLSPLVRRLAREHNVDVAQVAGTGGGGRVTKQDILSYVERRATAPAVPARAVPAPEVAIPAFRPGERTQIVAMSVMRKRIAEHMVLSKRTSAHVHSVVDVDFTQVARIRDAKKAEYERAGVKLTYLAFIARAVVDGIRAVPVVNASIDGDNIVYKNDVNLGIAVALESGLIVPVIRNADEKNVLALARAIQDVATRARTKQLKPDEVQEGTFTITNPGSLGTLMGMPIINQPQVAILGVGVIEKRPVVVNDAVAIRWRAYLTLGYDHRLIDGAVADEFLSHVRHALEVFDPAAA